MHRSEHPISGQQSQPSNQRRKRKPQPDNSESSKFSNLGAQNRNERFIDGNSLQNDEIPQKKSDEFLKAHSMKRARTGLQQRNSNPTAGEKGEAVPVTTRTRRTKSKAPSSRQSRRLVQDGRSFALSAEPPPAIRSHVMPQIEQTPSNDPDFELRMRAREEYRETGNYSAFHTLLAPFIKGNTERELSDWVYNEEKQRWRREDKSTGTIIWAPTSDSFL